MDVGNTNGWRLDDVVSSDEIVAAIDAVHPLEPVAAGPPRRDRPPLPLPRRRRRDRRHRLGDEAVLRRLLAGPPLGRGPPPHLPFRAARATICARRCGSGASDEELAGLLRGIWSTRTDRYSELRTAETAALPKVEMSYIGG